MKKRDNLFVNFGKINICLGKKNEKKRNMLANVNFFVNFGKINICLGKKNEKKEKHAC